VSLPVAIVTVRLLRIEGIPPNIFSDSERVIAVAWIGHRAIGRSRPIPRGTTRFELHRQNEPWLHVVEAMGVPIQVRLELWDDRHHQTARSRTHLTHFIEPPYRQGERTTSGITSSVVRLTLDVTTVAVTGLRALSVPRHGGTSDGAEGGGTRVSVPAPRTAGLVVELSEIQGLYQPSSPSSRVRSQHVAGYRSEDDRGRIFVNSTRDGRYRRDEQSIELTARLHSPSGRPLPAGAQIRWTMTDVDDPFDVDPRVHRQWLRYLDQNDYTVAGEPTGARGSDNEGRPSRTPPWEAVSGFAFVGAATNTQVTTQAPSGESKVVLHCPDVGGDCFTVLAEVTGVPGAHIPARTGVMTMWKRIFVEQVEMPGALPLPVAEVPPLFEDARVELNFTPPRRLATAESPMGENHAALGEAAERFCRNNFRHARNRQGGWFFLASALVSYRDVGHAGVVTADQGSGHGGGRPVLYRGRASNHGPLDGGTRGLLDVSGHVTLAGESWLVVRWGGHELWFDIVTASRYQAGPSLEPRTQIIYNAHSLARNFEAQGMDGSHAHAYRHLDHYLLQSRTPYNGPTRPRGGYPAPDPVDIEVLGPTGGSGSTVGKSPGIVHERREYFAGRTVVFTHHVSEVDSRGRRVYTPGGRAAAVKTIAHELTHAFGMPHICGGFDVRSPPAATTGASTCFMNYRYIWATDEEGNLVAGSMDRIGTGMCGRHIKELRRVHLEDNTVLRRFGW
jgi:hypothetical protein